MVRTCVIAPINVCRRRFFARNQVCVSLECVCRIVMCVCMWVSSNKPNPDSNKIVPPRPEEERKSIVVNQRYLNNAHERKIIIRIKSKVFFSMFLLQLCSCLQLFYFFHLLSARALGIYFCFVLLSIFFSLVFLYQHACVIFLFH